MRSASSKSLSTKIMFSIAIISLLIVIVISVVSEKVTKEAFYSVEIEKAKIIAKTIEPLIALDIYLDLNGKIKQIATNLIQNPNILAVTVLKNNKVIDEIKSAEYENKIEDSFKIKNIIFEPNTTKKIGTLILTYSSKNYKELRDKYAKLSIALLLFFVLLFLVFGLYVKRLLSPLRKIASSLINYYPDKKISIPKVIQNNEIGLISNALNKMQDNILQYSKKQQNINQYLEEKVDEKTLELRTQLYTNSLTGVPNRLSLLKDISGLENGALFIINIDDFREINDFYGQEIGDKILIDFSQRLKSMFDGDNNIKLNHLSGDEFALLFMEKPSLKEFTKIAEKLVNDIEKIISLHENNEIAIRVTVGGAYLMQGAIEKADIALKSAKNSRKSFLIYDENLNIEKKYKNNMQWVKKLKQAIKDERIIPYYQPIFDNKSGKLASCECLIRLIDENDEVVPPFYFLDIAKKSRLYSTLTKIMLRKSCQYFENIDCDFSVNMSVEDMLDAEVVNYVKYMIRKFDVSKKIVFEILESEGIENYKEVSSFISDMKALGCRIAIDDFGSGYSSFEYLLQLDVDYIKIDGTLIKDIDSDRNSQVVTQTIVDFAKKLNMLTIAEYVHNDKVFTKVKEFNVDRTQGFHLAEPQKDISSYLDI